MMLPAFWNEAWTAALANHLWQSTAVTGIVWLLALSLRSNHARTRYWLWMIASVKYLIPFSLLISAGESLRALFATPIQRPALAAVMEQITLPFPQAAAPAAVTNAPMAQSAVSLPANLLLSILIAVWLCGFLVVVFSWLRGWLRIRASIRASSRMTLLAEVPVLCSPLLIEPGIFGIFRPVLLLPKGIIDRLSPAQFSTIIAHEICHVRRRDNLTAAIHMVVEALFWFHPAVWWIKNRLLEEREQACDEAVLQSGNVADVYAESILNVCKFCIESPLACVAGVAGSDLKRRIVRIMTEKVARNLNLGRKLLAERFKLSFHRDKKELLVYALSTARTGPKLTRSVANSNQSPGLYLQDLGKLKANNATMHDFVDAMQYSVLDRPVLDRTGIAGRYAFTLNWTPDESQFRRWRALIPHSTGTKALPPLSVAIQEQLGLKFDSAMASAEILVIDHVEKPANGD